MTYAKVENQVVIEYPLQIGDITKRFPNSSFPFPFEAPDGYEPVEPTPQPTCDHTENLVEGLPTFVDGTLKQSWILEPATEEEIENRTEREGARIRLIRNSLLMQCDWTQLSDSTADKDLWAEYRQLLRDVPSQQGFPWNVAWPQKP